MFDRSGETGAQPSIPYAELTTAVSSFIALIIHLCMFPIRPHLM